MGSIDSKMKSKKSKNVTSVPGKPLPKSTKKVEKGHSMTLAKTHESPHSLEGKETLTEPLSSNNSVNTNIQPETNTTEEDPIDACFLCHHEHLFIFLLYYCI